MRYFIGCVALLLAFAGCSSTETVQQKEETEPAEPIEQESPIPSWYNAGVHSSSDSLSIHGYALASAMDSSRAAELSTETALEYLRLEIDRTTEEVRKELSDLNSGNTDYTSPSFIIHLRNTISDLSLDVADITIKHEASDKGVHYSYAKASISRTELPVLLGDELNDQVFLQEIAPISP